MNQPFDLNTRRRFLRDSSLLAAALFVPAGALATPAPNTTMSLERIGFGAFAANARSTFWVRRDPAPAVGLQLAEAQAGPPTADVLQAVAPDAGNEKFSLFFVGLADEPLEQDTYIFEHGRIGRFAMFIVPIMSRDPSRAYYEAVFNRPKPGSHAAV